uniref:Zinc finger CCCH domain-containing protein 15 n=1 Tax=Microcebus murinus TaxID=30608 RepID=A0A8C5VL80_MICMU
GAAKRRNRKRRRLSKTKLLKGAKQQKFIKAVTHQVKAGQQNPRQVAQSGPEKKLKKDDKKKELQELNELFKPVVSAQKINQGQCTKGDKCKFSHDSGEKIEKRSVYIDARDEELEKDTMGNWDEKKLEEVVNKNYGELEKKKSKTQIVLCPGGGHICMHCHALLPGFVILPALGPNIAKITLESFLAWKKKKRQEKIDKLEQDMKRRKADFKAGKALVFEIFPELVNDDDDEEEADGSCYIQGTGGDEVDDSVSINDTDLSLHIPRDVDETGITVASLERFNQDENELSEASGGSAENGERSDLEEDNEGEVQENGAIDAVDENLFTGKDLHDLEEELNILDLEE